MYDCEKYKGCDNCLDENTNKDDYPCKDCSPLTLSRWNPKVESEEDLTL